MFTSYFFLVHTGYVNLQKLHYIYYLFSSTLINLLFNNLLRLYYNKCTNSTFKTNYYELIIISYYSMNQSFTTTRVFIFFFAIYTNAVLGTHWSCVKRCTENGKCQKYLFSNFFACLETNAALGAHWSCVKRCAEDGKCV